MLIEMIVEDMESRRQQKCGGATDQIETGSGLPYMVWPRDLNCIASYLQDSIYSQVEVFYVISINISI